MNKLTPIIWIFCVFLIVPRQINGQGRGGYDQFGEYVEEAPIDEKRNKKREFKRQIEKLNAFQEKLKTESHDAITHFMMGNILIQHHGFRSWPPDVMPPAPQRRSGVPSPPLLGNANPLR